MSKHSRAIFRIRYLCDAGVPSEIALPLLIDESKRLVRFGSWMFAWSNARGELINSATSPIRPETLYYFSEHFDDLTRHVGFSMHDAMRTFPPVSNPRRTGHLDPRIDESKSYREVWGPEGMYFNLTLAVRGPGEEPLGLVQLFRSKDDVDFDDADEESIGAVLPYLRRLLSRANDRVGTLLLVHVGLAGVAVFPEDGGLEFIADRAFTLATLAFNDRLPITSRGLRMLDPADRLRSMYREVRAGDAPRTRVLSNAWGVFSFEWESSLRRGARVWSVVIRHKIPARARLLQTPEGALLSDRQLEVCRRLLDGEPIPEIAERIGVRRATMKDHTREIYRKFGVSDRVALLRKIAEAVPSIV